MSTVSSLVWVRLCMVSSLPHETLLSFMDSNSRIAYMSHFDKLVRLPEGFVVVAKTAHSEFAGIAHQTKPIFGAFSFTVTLHAIPSTCSLFLGCSVAPLTPSFAPFPLLSPLLYVAYRPLTSTILYLLTNLRCQQAYNFTPSLNTYAHPPHSVFLAPCHLTNMIQLTDSPWK